LNLLASRRGRRLLFTALYLSEGAPIGYIWWALPTILRAAGIEVGTITALTSMLVLPWVFKFAWAPLIDGVRSLRWTLRSWILSSQLLMGCALIPLLVLDPATELGTLVPFLLLSTIAAATQDASIDALAISTVPLAERGSVNGWMQLGMLVGRSALGGGALLLNQRLGTSVVIVLLVAVVWSSSILLLFSREPVPDEHETQNVRSRLRALYPRMAAVARSRTTWLGLLFAATAGAGFEGVGAVAGPFLIDQGFTQEDIGTFFALYSVAAMAGGALIGGYVTDRAGTRRSVALFLLLLSATVCSLAALAAGTPERLQDLLLPVMTFLYACIGMFTASSYALFMEITDPALGATQFSAFMGATNGCESWSGLVVGRIVTAFGYPLAFATMACISLAALPLVRHIARTTPSSE